MLQPINKTISGCAVDPGPHCGIAYIDKDGSYHTEMFHNDLPSVIDYIVLAEPAEIVIERFVPYDSRGPNSRMDRNKLDTVECQGAVQAVSIMLGCKLRWHTAQIRMPFLASARQILKVGRAKIDSHEVDALAHLLAWQEIKYADWNCR